jgi:hypothetical protein
VLALILGSLLQRRAAQNGLSMSLHALLQSLSDIQEVTSIYPATGQPGSRGRPRTQTTLSEMNPRQEALYGLFNLDRYRQA